jgi:hypothetical protein
LIFTPPPADPLCASLAQETGRNTKILLKVTDIGVTY